MRKMRFLDSITRDVGLNTTNEQLAHGKYEKHADTSQRKQRCLCLCNVDSDRRVGGGALGMFGHLYYV